VSTSQIPGQPPPQQPPQYPRQQPGWGPYGPQSPRKRHRLGKLLLAGLAVAVVIGGVAAGLALTSGPAPFTAHGNIELCTSPALGGGGTPAEDYPDVTSGGQVTILDQQQHVITTATLTSGASMNTGLLDGQFYNWSAKVPAGLARYGVEIGHDRGTVWFSERQMHAGPSTSLGC
jgi:hypothetical protein